VLLTKFCFQIYTPKNYREKLIRWIICDDQPFTVVEETNLRHLFKMLRPEVECLSGDTVKVYILSMFEEERNRMRKVLQDAPGKISFTLDAWTSRNQLPFLGITAHWVDSEWNLRSTLLNFQLLSGPHSGENLQETFESSCRELGILTKASRLIFWFLASSF
jgi:hypothetical protein